MSNGGWVFISHSHQDIELVRRIRNHLESLGLEPLMFYLKCLSDENEIEELIKREIRERDWFIYADSDNARASRWVKTERDYIENLAGKKVFTIDLKDDVAKQLAHLEHIAKQMKVYISYSRRDIELEGRIRQRLLERDMLVLTDGDIIKTDTPWSSIVRETIEDASRNGFVILLITEGSMHSEAVKREIELTLRMGGKLVPVYVGKASLSPELLGMIGDVQGIHLSSVPTDEELDRIVDSIFNRVEYYHSDYRDTVGYRSARSIRLPAIARIDEMTFFDCDNLECVFIPDSVIYITPDAFDDHPDILIKCSRGSYAEGYCIKHGIRYEITEE